MLTGPFGVILVTDICDLLSCEHQLFRARMSVSPGFHPMRRAPSLSPVSIACIYLVLAGSWILFSDTLMHRLKLSEAALYTVGVSKGIAFVLVTSVILFFLVRRMVSQMERDRLEHEAALQQSEERFSMAFNASPEGMAISSLHDGRYLEVNEAFLSMLGYTRDEVIGRSTMELGIWAHPDQRKALGETLLRGLPAQGVSTMLRRKDGQLVDVEMSAQKILLGGQYYFLGIGRDVSLQKRLEQQFLEAQKMEALGQLAAGVAHDFRNLLMLIRGYTEMLELHGLKNSDYRNQVLAAVKKAETLSRQLLAYSRKQEAKPEALDLNAVVSEVSGMLSEALSRNIQASTVLENGLWTVNADRGQVEQVLMNLAVNAHDAMPRGGALVISTSNRKVDQGFGHDAVMVPAGEYVELVVRDTGCGIPPEIMGKIFEPFFTTKERGKGTGLGLSAVYGIVKQSNGFTLVESQPGAGTTFRILLPRHSVARKELVSRMAQV